MIHQGLSVAVSRMRSICVYSPTVDCELVPNPLPPNNTPEVAGTSQGSTGTSHHGTTGVNILLVAKTVIPFTSHMDQTLLRHAVRVGIHHTSVFKTQMGKILYPKSCR